MSTSASVYQVRQSLQPIFAWDFERVIMTHSSIIEQDGKQQFQLGYECFLDALIQFSSICGVPEAQYVNRAIPSALDLVKIKNVSNRTS